MVVCHHRRGQSFHFATRYKTESFHESILRHEYFLASHLNVKPGEKVLDVGCGVGGPLRNIARFTKVHTSRRCALWCHAVVTRRVVTAHFHLLRRIPDARDHDRRVRLALMVVASGGWMVPVPVPVPVPVLVVTRLPFHSLCRCCPLLAVCARLV